MTDPAWLSGKQLASKIRRGELSAVEALDTFAERIRRLNPAINAVVATDLPRARRRAAAADRARAKGAPLGPLHGVPMTVKESFDVPGLATTVGFEAQRTNLPTEPAVVVERLEAAGAIVFGKT
ncbi:MAG: amidase family protein, partial [Burkholderiales bacterium]